MCAHAETNGRDVHARRGTGARPSVQSSLPAGDRAPAGSETRDPLRRPRLSMEHNGRAGAEDLWGPRLRLRISFTFSRVKDGGSVPSPPGFARAITLPLPPLGCTGAWERKDPQPPRSAAAPESKFLLISAHGQTRFPKCDSI